jgi:hypothetical protein
MCAVQVSQEDAAELLACTPQVTVSNMLQK